jgi:hypothetical protein
MKLSSPWNIILSAVAVGVGLVTLAGYFFADLLPELSALAAPLLAIGSLLAAVAVWAGAVNLLRVHITRMFSQPGGWYGIFVVIGFLFALVIGLLARGDAVPDVIPADALQTWVYQPLIAPVGATLSALLAVLLTLAGLRIMQRSLTLASVVFLLTAVVALFSLAPTLAGLPGALTSAGASVWALLSQVLAVGGGRGLLLGIALGIVTAGLRVLLILDRPYGD